MPKKSSSLSVALFLLLVATLAFAGWQTAALRSQQPQPGPIEIGFSQAMSQHHQQAILMAGLMDDGRPTRLTPLIRNIRNSQLYEYGQLQGWLQLWDEPLYPSPLKMDWMALGKTPPDEELRQYLLDCEASETGMPGLFPLTVIDELRKLEGDARDTRFLEFMLEHHAGALPMARFTAEEATLKPVTGLARRILREQFAEMALMRRSLNLLQQEAGKTSARGK